jgi:hyperosmotically inducible periplasmic protein
MVTAFAMVMGLSACQAPAGRTAGDVVDNSAITKKAKAQLLADDELSGFAISVKTFEEEMTLTGSVENHYQNAHAEETVQLVHVFSTALFM